MNKTRNLPQRFITFLLLISCCFAQLQFPSSYTQLGQAGITLFYEFNDDNQTIIMGLDMNATVDYYAVGFAGQGNSGMQTFDIVSFVFIPDSTTNTYTVQVSDLYSNAYAQPPTDVSLGGTSDYYLIDSYVVPGRTQVLFQRAYNTGDSFDYIFNPNITKDGIVLNYAFNNINQYSLSYHGNNAGTVTTQLFNGGTGTGKSSPKPIFSIHVVICLHSYIMSFCWGILIEIAIQIARYHKSLKHYIVVHAGLASVLYTLTAVASGFALYVTWGEVSGALSSFHMYIGYITVALCTVQTVLGVIFRIKMEDDKITKAIPSLSKVHLFLGLFIYLLTKAQIGLGLYMFKPAYMIYFYIYCGLIFVLRVGQELWHRKQRLTGANMPEITGSDSTKEKHQALMKLLNTNTTISEILDNSEVKDVRWAILDDKVFDLDGFTHPGGVFILNHIKGREVGRFIYGSYGIEALEQQTQHVHTEKAISVIKKNLIGTLQSTQYILIPREMETTEEVASAKLKSFGNPNPTLLTSTISADGQQQGLPDFQKVDVTWKLAKKTSLTNLISKFEFVCKDYTINPWVKDVRHLGRHLKVSHSSHQKIRLYTLVLSQTESRTKRRDYLWNKIYNPSESHANSSREPISESLPLIIKKYNFIAADTFSSFIHGSDIDMNGFKIEGPYGTGLDLTPDSTGIHYIFAAGTGILPFIDLFDYLLEGVLDPTSGNNLFKNGFKLHVFGSFNHINDFIGLDICEKLAKACADKGMKDAFGMTIRTENAKTNDFYNVTDDTFDGAFILKHVNKCCERAYVCGPPSFNLRIPAGLKLLGLTNSKIILV